MNTYNRPFNYQSPVKTFVNYDTASLIQELMQPYNAIGVVTGKSSHIKSGFKSFIEENLGSVKKLQFFSEVEENPSIETILKGREFFREHQVDAIIAFGGGSVMDAAKAISYFTVNDGEFYSLIEQPAKKPGLHLFTIPGTCGSGSEMNNYAIITDHQTKDKVNFNKENTFPKAAILEPAFLESLPEHLLIATVFDAFTHAFEGFLAKKSQPFSDALALHAISQITSGLKEFNSSQVLDKELIKQFLYASSIAGVVILHTGTTLLHAMGYYLTNHFGVHHGKANALLLPAYVNICKEKGIKKIAEVERIFEQQGFDLFDYASDFYKPETVSTIVPPEQREAMIAYAVGKKNTENTPFVVGTTMEVSKAFFSEY